MNEDIAASVYVVRVTIMEETGKAAYHYFLTGCDNDADAIANVRAFPGILLEDNVIAMRRLSHIEIAELAHLSRVVR